MYAFAVQPILISFLQSYAQVDPVQVQACFSYMKATFFIAGTLLCR